MKNVHVTHRHHVVDLPDTKPVKNIGHERLETHVLDTGDELSRLEVLVRRVAAPLSEVVDEVPRDVIVDRRPTKRLLNKDVLRDLAQCTALLAEVDDETDTAALCPADALFDRVDEVGLARANVGTEHVRAVACRSSTVQS